MFHSATAPALLLSLAVVLVSGCRARDAAVSDPASISPEVELPPEVPGYIFVGCRPNEGECYNSCEDHRYLKQADESRFCKIFGTVDGPYECHCYIGDEGPNEPASSEVPPADQDQDPGQNPNP